VAGRGEGHAFSGATLATIFKTVSHHASFYGSPGIERPVYPQARTDVAEGRPPHSPIRLGQNGEPRPSVLHLFVCFVSLDIPDKYICHA
jgi:hypothetical protein